MQEMRYEDGQFADLLDIISIPMVEPRPQGHQTENHLIAAGGRWGKQSRATWNQIVSATDRAAGPIWLNGPSSYHGMNDKVPEADANAIRGSLMLIEPTALHIAVGYESKYLGGAERKVRAHFTLNGLSYNFVITDPWIEAKYLAGADGYFRVDGPRLCVSLAEVINGHAIKLVAAVITPERIG